MTTRRNVLAGGSMFLAAATTLPFARAQQVPAPKSAADVPGTPPGTIMTKDYVVMVARAAGIVVETGLLADEAAGLYTGYRRWLATGRPLVEAADDGAGFDAAFHLLPDENAPQALKRLGEAGYTRLWVEHGGMLEQILRDQDLLD